MDAKQEGALLQQVADIKTNTDKIPDMTTMLALHDQQIKDILPLVKSHEAMSQRALTLAGICSLVGGFFSYIVGQRGGH